MSATETALGKLHLAITEVLTAQIEYQEEETTWDEDGNEVRTGEMKYIVPPATIAAAVKFLKDNNITCDIENDSEMGKLQEALEKKQRRSRMPPAKVAALHAVE